VVSLNTTPDGSPPSPAAAQQPLQQLLSFANLFPQQGAALKRFLRGSHVCDGSRQGQRDCKSSAARSSAQS